MSDLLDKRSTSLESSRKSLNQMSGHELPSQVTTVSAHIATAPENAYTSSEIYRHGSSGLKPITDVSSLLFSH